MLPNSAEAMLQKSRALPHLLEDLPLRSLKYRGIFSACFHKLNVRKILTLNNGLGVYLEIVVGESTPPPDNTKHRCESERVRSRGIKLFLTFIAWLNILLVDMVYSSMSSAM